MAICRRCGLSIRNATRICPGCGQDFNVSDGTNPGRDYYALFGLSAHLPDGELKVSLKEAARVWSRRANNSPQIEQRHEAELMIRYLAEAEVILLDPVKRRAYDESLKNQRQSGSRNTAPPNTSRKRESSRPPSTTCPRCGLRDQGNSGFCPACGFGFPNPSDTESSRQSAPRQSSGTRTTGPTSPSSRSGDTGNQEPVSPSISDILSTFNGRKRMVTGTVIAIDPLYMAKPEARSFLIKFVIWLFLLPLVICLVITAMLVSFSFSMFSSGQSNRPGFFTNITSQMTSFFLTGKLFGPKEQIPVRDIRLQGGDGQHQLVRIRGELVAGNVNVGDEIDVQGVDRHGTLMFESGWNRRIRTEIRVRRR